MKDEKFKFYQVEPEKREEIIQKLISLLGYKDEILFAYMHGSFLVSKNFRDIDIAVYLDEANSKEQLKYELRLEEELTRELNYPVDVRSLNQAPPSFAYAVIKNGRRILVNDEDKRVDFEMRTLQKYFDFLPFLRRYLQEA